MLIQRLNRDDPERVFISCYNHSGSALSKGQLCVFSMDGTRDGYEITDPTAPLSSLVAGLAHAATAAAEYGLIQVYGLDDDALIQRNGTSTSAHGAIGDVLLPWTASSALSAASSGEVAHASAYTPWFILAQTQASTNSANLTTTAKVFIRCM